MQNVQQKKRWDTLDFIRGFTVINMVLYHGIWDIQYVFWKNINVIGSKGGHIWQQSICILFIFLSGFCYLLGKKQGRRSLLIFGLGAILSIITSMAMPNSRILFGVLTLIGSCGLILTGLHKVDKKLVSGFFGELKNQKTNTPLYLAVIFLVFFLCTKNINQGTIGVSGIIEGRVPEVLYQNLFSAYLGFPGAKFFSTDYFPLLPWFFLYVCGYFTYCYVDKKGYMNKLPKFNVPIVNFLGKKALWVYVLHQPLLYGFLYLLFQLVE